MKRKITNFLHSSIFSLLAVHTPDDEIKKLKDLTFYRLHCSDQSQTFATTKARLDGMVEKLLVTVLKGGHVEAYLSFFRKLTNENSLILAAKYPKSRTLLVDSNFLACRDRMLSIYA